MGWYHLLGMCLVVCVLTVAVVDYRLMLGVAVCVVACWLMLAMAGCDVSDV